MKYYTSTTQFNCGIDLHARQMYVCLMDRDGKKLVHTNIQGNDWDYGDFLDRHCWFTCCFFVEPLRLMGDYSYRCDKTTVEWFD